MNRLAGRHILDFTDPNRFILPSRPQSQNEHFPFFIMPIRDAKQGTHRVLSAGDQRQVDPPAVLRRAASRGEADTLGII